MSAGGATPVTLSLDGLISLAREITSSEFPIEIFVDKIHSYTEAFDAWSKQNEGMNTGVLSEEERGRGRVLLELHSNVLECANRLLGQTSQEMRDLKQKRRVILAYTDTLPRSISVTGKTKG